MESLKNVYKILVGKPERKRTLETSKYISDDNIKIYLRNRIGGCRLNSRCQE
jgi:hypothetical protein